MPETAPARRRRLTVESLESRWLLAGDLRITEINFNPHPALPQWGDRNVDADEFEFIELANLGDQPLNLSGYRIEDGVKFEFAAQVVAPDEYLVVVKDARDFRSRYGSQIRLAAGNDGEGGRDGEYGGNFRNSGEPVRLIGPDGSVVHQFEFFDAGEWPTRSDGFGSSLEIVDPWGDYSDPKNWRASSEFGGSPGRAGTGPIGDVVFNELLTHTDDPLPDLVELHNTTDRPIDVTGWYISDAPNDVFKFTIRGPNAVIRPFGYMVFDQGQLGFAIQGQQADDLYLVQADATGRPIRFADAVAFGATQNAVTLGRWPNGTGELFPMATRTFGNPNSEPLPGDVVIGEIHYHPADPQPGSGLTADDLEFVELVNRTGARVTISHWRLQQAVNYVIPENTTLAPNETLVVVSFDPLLQPQKVSQFQSVYDVPTDVRIVGPYSDATDPNADLLDDDGETLILDRPEDLAQLGRGYVLVDRVIYRDRDPWPGSADGQRDALVRRDLDGYGDFAATWRAARPTPGRLGLRGDIDGNGVVNAADVDQLCAAARTGTGRVPMDLNQDGRVDQADAAYLISTILRTTPGDADLDGRFDTRDLIIVFQAGQFEDGISGNSGWATGDWNCDAEFDTGDLVAAFRAGGFIREARSSAISHLSLGGHAFRPGGFIRGASAWRQTAQAQQRPHAFNADRQSAARSGGAHVEAAVPAPPRFMDRDPSARDQVFVELSRETSDKFRRIAIGDAAHTPRHPVPSTVQALHRPRVGGSHD